MVRFCCRKFFLGAVFVFLFTSVLSAEKAVEKEGAAVKQLEKVVLLPVPEKKTADAFLQGLEPYKNIYVVNTWFLDGEGTDQGYQDQELLLHFSFKRLILWNLYFAYTHKAFWQIYDIDNSRPFREHNYNPELFLEWDDVLRLEYVRLGLIEHESNGEKLRYNEAGRPVNYSRTWNRVYAYARKSIHPLVTLGLKAWIVTDSDDPEDGSFIVDNADIQQYMGNGEFYADFGTFPSLVSIMYRQGWGEGTETIRIEGRMPLNELTGWIDRGVDIYLQMFSGYGDSLIDYDRKITRLSFGVAFR